MPNTLKDAYAYIKPFLLNGVFSYSLFGMYALTIAPMVGDFVSSGKYNPFIAFFGFSMLIAEFFAIKFKLKMVRVRAGQRRIEQKEKTGVNLLPNTSMFVLFEFFLRLLIRVPISMICMTALGYTATERVMSKEGVIVVMFFLIADIAGLAYLFLRSDFYTDPPPNKKVLEMELKEDDEWDKANGYLLNSEKHIRLELLADIVLNVYSVMIYTALWSYINAYGIDKVNVFAYEDNSSAIACALDVFPMLFILCVFALIPVRIAYWIEDSMMAYSKLEKAELYVTFVIIAFFTCFPTIWHFISVYFLNKKVSFNMPAETDMGDLGALALFVCLLFLRLIIFLFKYKKQKNGNN